MPSIQWYSSAKQPPGQRRTGILLFFRAATTSLRMPRVLGIGLSSPTQIAAVDAVAEVLGEMAVDVPVDRAPCPGRHGSPAGWRARPRWHAIQESPASGCAGREIQRFAITFIVPLHWSSVDRIGRVLVPRADPAVEPDSRPVKCLSQPSTRLSSRPPQIPARSRARRPRINRERAVVSAHQTSTERLFPIPAGVSEVRALQGFANRERSLRRLCDRRQSGKAISI